MSIFVLNGLSNSDTAYNSIYHKLITELNGVSIMRSVNLEESNIASCKGCFGCWFKTPGTCVIDDQGREIARDFINNDTVIFLTPVTFGGFSSTLKKAVDRLIPNILPHFQKINGEIHHKPRYEKYPRIIAVGLLEKEDSEAESIFDHLINRISINMFSPEHKSFFLYNSNSDEDLEQLITDICKEVDGI